jgi:hypothetical protein
MDRCSNARTEFEQSMLRSIAYLSHGENEDRSAQARIARGAANTTGRYLKASNPIGG